MQASEESDASRGELGAHFHRLYRDFVAAELPILTAHGLVMWDYVILSALAARSTSNQLELAQLTGRDKTRLIKNLDSLEAAGLVNRTRDPADRRNTRVALTEQGRIAYTDCHTDIRAMDDERLASFSTEQRRTFFAVLNALQE